MGAKTKWRVRLALGASAALCMVTLITGCAAGHSQSAETAAVGGPQWWCIADLGIDHGVCAPEVVTCKQWRKKGSQGRLDVSPCKPQPIAWCFEKPVAGSATTYDTCQPTSSDCGLARRNYMDENPQPSLNCREYPVPG